MSPRDRDLSVTADAPRHHVRFLARAVLLKSPNSSAVGTVPCCHVARPQGRFCSREGRRRRPQSCRPSQVAVPAEVRLDPIPADLKTRLGKGWEGTGRETMLLPALSTPSSSSQPISLPQDTAAPTGTELLPHPAPTGGCLGTHGCPGCGSDQLQRTSPAGDLHSKPPSSQPCKTRKKTKRWRRGRHTWQRRSCTPRYRPRPNALFHRDAGSDLRLSGPTSHCLIS